tara:strand:+ start:347 stop:916 length:570 start_codon:yes stop_codon:yes gene_type:complete
MTKGKQKKLETGIEIKQDILENQANVVYLSLGSNLGKKKINLINAKFLLQTCNYIKIIKVSRYYKTASWPNKNDPFFLNIVIKIKTRLTPLGLFKLIKNIEKLLGRKKTPKNSPRECDIDILDYGRKRFRLNFNREKIIIPHPRMHKRNFVLIPLFEICKNWKHPELSIEIPQLLKDLKLDNLRSIKLL